MKSSTIVAASALLIASTSADGIGSAVVVNACSYSVYLENTPAAGGGYSTISQTLAPNAQYSQEYTQLSNTDGWSLKLSKSSSSMENIMQYEYTFHNDGTIWYDLSDVNGNPWDGNWEISSSESDCNPVHQEYRYSTDDAYGMQACAQNASLTVTLCSGDDSGSTTTSSASSATATVASTSASISVFISASASATSTANAAATTEWGWGGEEEVSDATSTAASQTTLATAVITSAASVNANVVVVTEVLTTTVWEEAKAKRNIHRHQHHQRHPHGQA